MFNKNEKAYIALELYDTLTYHKKREILDLFSSPCDIFDEINDVQQELSKILGTNVAKDFSQTIDERQVDQYILNTQKLGITILTCKSENYPQKLLNYADYPLVLYAKGDVSLLNQMCFGIVGTRKITRYGRDVTEKFATSLAQNNLVIVSGMADGVDTIAHKSTLAVKGKTIAVLGSGFNNIYPMTNFELSKRIEAEGLLLTEYKPSTKPSVYTFPVRNRIIAGLSSGVLITEAGLKSGAMYTKDYCIDYNVNLYVVPGNIDNSSSSGCNQVLKSCQANLVTCVEDILLDMNMSDKSPKQHKISYQLSLEEQLITNTIKNEEMHLDEIAILTKLDTKELLRYLTIMEINGIIEKLHGNYYRNRNYQE